MFANSKLTARGTKSARSFSHEAISGCHNKIHVSMELRTVSHTNQRFSQMTCESFAPDWEQLTIHKRRPRRPHIVLQSENALCKGASANPPNFEKPIKPKRSTEAINQNTTDRERLQATMPGPAYPRVYQKTRQDSPKGEVSLKSLL